MMLRIKPKTLYAGVFWIFLVTVTAQTKGWRGIVGIQCSLPATHSGPAARKR
jgi:hypothetical protein